MKEHKASLTKWLGMLLYIQIAYMAITCINAVTHWDNVTAWVNKGITAIGIWCLFQLQVVNPRYRTAAITRAGAFICGLLTLPVNTSGLGLSSILLLVGSACTWITDYQEYHGHSEIAAQWDEKLAKKWNDLFVWEVVVALATSVVSLFGTVLLMAADMLTDTITTVIIILSTILGLVLEGLYLLYMKRTLHLSKHKMIPGS